MVNVLRTNAKHLDFIKLVNMLDTDLALRDGDDHTFYDQFNAITHIKHSIVLFDQEKPVACGAIKKFDSERMEIKRMYTLPAHRGKGLASLVLIELEEWAHELGFSKCVLETGKRQSEAIQLYLKNGYLQIPNYGQYKGIDNSLCFEKDLSN